MADWTKQIEAKLAALELPSERAREIAEELAQHLEDRRRDLILTGVAEAEAERQAWDELEISDLLAELNSAVPPQPRPGGREKRLSRFFRRYGLFHDFRYSWLMLRKT